MRTGMSGGLLDETIAPLTGRPTPASTLGKPGSSGLLARNPKAQSAVSLGKAVPLKKLGSTGDVLKIQGKGSAFGLVQPGRGPEFFQKRKIVSLADFSSVRTTSRPVTSVEDAHTSPDSTPGRCTFYIGNVS